SVVAAQTKPATRLSHDLAELAGLPLAATARAESETAPESFSALPPVAVGDWVTIDAAATGDPAELEAELISLGARDTAIAGRLVSARLPIATIASLEAVASLRFARRAVYMNRAGQVTTQGDKVVRADIARNTFGLNGSGVTVGVVSTSFNCLGGANSDM